jgi:hypothetical protein
VHISDTHFPSFFLLFLFTIDFVIFILDSAIPPYDTIPRRPRSHYLSLYKDPEDWTPTVKVTRDTPVYLQISGMIFHDEQPHDIMPLLSRDLSATAPLTHLLGKEMIDGEVFHSDIMAISWVGPATLLRGRGTFFVVQMYIAVFSCRCFGITSTHLCFVPSVSDGTTPLTPSSLMIRS